MGLPLLDTKYSSKPHRVASIPAVNAEDKPWVLDRYDLRDEQGLQSFIFAAYRQIFSEHLILESNRQTELESQLRNGKLLVKDFVRGLGKSEVFRRLVLEPNTNYRFVEICLKRFLGREPYNKQELIKWSIIIAEKGYHAFIDAVVDGAEYAEAFGEDTLPYQRRPLSQPFNLTTPRLADIFQDDQRSPWERYAGPKFFVGWKDTVEGYTVFGPPKPGDSKAFLDIALSIASQNVSPTRVSVWDIKIPDMTKR
ncbi:phycobilisome rod-core linker polypeptide [Anthocerotibacter panamensis]|uniref:CpcG n=1 Tax=Anthocerotibacter panamensis TaxID=2857077 RepID=A0AAJ6N6G4_9CYAN|nr:phycobilisome rod-core linker polypeptide [Anthocerotibacter panamensis]8IML_4 Chain 4, CpcG [Anthocerotibacter panamensis]8IMM_4 Chain 4, CpcG [Anthocerotibacter panamensis]